MPAFSGLGHLALKVNDLQTSLDFYRRLGFPEFLRLTETNGEPWIAYLKISDGLYLELFSGGDGSKVPGPEYTGVHHLCLTTEDIEATAAHLASGRHPIRRAARSNRGAAPTAITASGSPTRTATGSRSWKWRRTASSTRRYGTSTRDRRRTLW